MKKEAERKVMGFLRKLLIAGYILFLIYVIYNFIKVVF